MIEKFNFYDVYGYFLPGAALLLLFWLPFGLVNNSWPASDWGSAAVAVALSYFAGHLLQMVSTKTIPSSVAKGKKDRDRYPSDVVVDLDNKAFSKEFKTNLAALVLKKFKIDLRIKYTDEAAEEKKDAGAGDVKSEGAKGADKDKDEGAEVDRARRDAFFLARHVLVQAKEVSYGEQFEGLYSLMRGLCAALGLAVSNYIGWSLSTMHRGWLDCVVVVEITVSLLAAGNFSAHLLRKGLAAKTPLQLERWNAGALLLVSLGLGYGLGRRYNVTAFHAEMLVLCAIGAFLGCVRAYSAYKSFSMHFAITIWRDFFASMYKEQREAGEIDV